MKKDSIIKLTLLNTIFLLFLVIFPPVASYADQPDDETIAKADDYYKAGISAYENSSWSDAEKNFEASYNCFPHTLTAYMLSCTYIELEKPARALEYANKALEGKPKLEEPYRGGAIGIVNWANEAKEDPYYKISGKADDYSHPKSPITPPPKPATPKTDTSEIKLPGVKLPSNFMVGKRGGKAMDIAINLTGTWHCDDGGNYFIRQVGNELWWYGQSGDGGKTWSNVFHGQIQKNRAVGKWADVPHGQTQNFGEMTIEILGANKLKTTQKTGGFGGSGWTREQKQ